MLEEVSPFGRCSTNSDPEYFDEHGEPVYIHAHMVQAMELNKKKHLIQFQISVNLDKVRNSMEGHCSTLLLKADTRADVNLLNSTFDKIIGDKPLLQPTSLRMERIWKQHGVPGARKVPRIPEMERQDLQAVILCDKCEFITKSSIQRQLLHPRSAETLLLN